MGCEIGCWHHEKPKECQRCAKLPDHDERFSAKANKEDNNSKNISSDSGFLLLLRHQSTQRYIGERKEQTSLNTYKVDVWFEALYYRPVTGKAKQCAEAITDYKEKDPDDKYRFGFHHFQ